MPLLQYGKNVIKTSGRYRDSEISAAAQPAAFAQMCAATGTRTVPQIFIGETHVGGFTDLRALHQQGGLVPLLNGESLS